MVLNSVLRHRPRCSESRVDGDQNKFLKRSLQVPVHPEQVSAALGIEVFKIPISETKYFLFCI